MRRVFALVSIASALLVACDAGHATDTASAEHSNHSRAPRERPSDDRTIVLHLGWGLFALSYPREWVLRRFSGTCSHGSFDGALITNLDTPLHHPRRVCTTAWDMRRLSPSIVVMQIARNVGPVFQTRHRSKEDTRFPLSMKEALRHRRGRFGAPRMREIRIWRDGLLAGSIDVWIGPGASPQDSAAVGRAVRSIRDETPFCSFDLPRGSIYRCT